MTRLQELHEKYKIVNKGLQELEVEYTGKIKGKAYVTKHIQLIEKAEYLEKQLLLYGTQGNIIMIDGTRVRSGKKNPSVRVQEKFTLYWVNVSTEDVPRLLKIRYPNIESYKMTVIKPGNFIIK